MNPRLRLAALLLTMITLSSAAEHANPQRWEKDVATLEAALRAHPPEIGSALFYGSSSIRLWTTLARDFPGVAAVNHGLGGATIADCTYYFDRLVVPVRPRVVVFSAGGNDLATGRAPEEVAADFRAFCAKWHAFSPVLKIVFCSLKLSPARWDLREKFALTNALIAAYCAADPRRMFLDVHSAMLKPDGQPRAELYLEDRMHLNAAGYKIWTELLAPHIDWRSTRFEKDILAFEEADRAHLPAPGGVLFTGASSIKFWTTLDQDFPGVPTINRGFGGSFLMDCVYYFNRLVPPYRPRLVVLSAGGNDFAFGHRTVEEIAGDFRTFRERLHAVLPETRLIYLATPQSPLRAADRITIDGINARIAAQCAADARCKFLDVNAVMAGSDGLPRPEIFRADRLHLNADGYATWTKLLLPLLK